MPVGLVHDESSDEDDDVPNFIPSLRRAEKMPERAIVELLSPAASSEAEAETDGGFALTPASICGSPCPSSGVPSPVSPSVHLEEYAYENEAGFASPDVRLGSPAPRTSPVIFDGRGSEAGTRIGTPGSELCSHSALSLDIHGYADEEDAVAESDTPPNAVYSPVPYSHVQSPLAAEILDDGSEDAEIGWSVQPSSPDIAESYSPVLDAASPGWPEAPSYVPQR
jgi:hypothetical protein